MEQVETEINFESPELSNSKFWPGMMGPAASCVLDSCGTREYGLGDTTTNPAATTACSLRSRSPAVALHTRDLLGESHAE